MDENVERAFIQYQRGDRPWRLVKRDWYVADKDGKLYPIKYIWALAIGQEPTSFNTKDAYQELAAREYSVVDLRASSDQALYDGDLTPESIIRDLPPDEIRKRAAEGDKKPVKTLIAAYQYQRNPYVVAAVLLRAAGHCESCREAAPFRKKRDGLPYLEVHHTIPLAEGGDDTIENAEALCPNCHREAHYG